MRRMWMRRFQALSICLVFITLSFVPNLVLARAESRNPQCEPPVRVERHIDENDKGVLLETELRFEHPISSPSYYPRGLPVDYEIHLVKDGKTLSIKAKIENDDEYDGYVTDFFNVTSVPSSEKVRWYVQMPDESPCPPLDLTAWDDMKKKLGRDPKLSFAKGACHHGKECTHIIMEGVTVQ